ncbi:MAG: hypothetical protein MI921_21920 [Cytophagales bacterium]|nr:hypothetical protein [Cytophagales bacterium]
MIEYNQKTNQLSIKIPISGMHELYAYQKSILAVLSHIEIDDCSPAFLENLKAVYRLLNHLTIDPAFLSEHSELFPEHSDLHKRHLQEKAKEP